MKNLQERLNALVEKQKQFSYIKDASFANESEFNDFYQEHKNDFEKLKIIKQEIDWLTWQIKSSVEKRLYRKYLIGLTLKFIDEKPDNPNYYKYQCLYLQLLDMIQNLLSMNNSYKDNLQTIYNYLDSKEFVFPIEKKIYNIMFEINEIQELAHEIKSVYMVK